MKNITQHKKQPIDWGIVIKAACAFWGGLCTLLIVFLFIPCLSFGQNKKPVANAGPDTVIFYPQKNNFSREGKGTDADGTITSYKWQIVGQVKTSATLLLNCDTIAYNYKLTVTDNKGATGVDTVVVTYIFNRYAPLVKIPIGDLGSLSITNGGYYVFEGVPWDPPTQTFDVSQCSPDGGYGYFMVMDFGIPSDNMAEMSRSTLKIFENGIELKPAHSLHADIRSLGNGRFSHWDNGLYFSASDNSNPKINGRTYTFITQ